ncbi:MAG: MBL fold metallo-hydrolase [Candidatus Aminicenantes bacterium]|nr:MBL fold metallo-hydrolase [Candidatus Aminicenantes bacterium]
MNTNRQIRMTIVYDNHSFDEDLQKDWGFSCFINGLEKSILFDTGKNGQILLSNMKKLNIRPEEIDLVFLSHAHNDHTDGLETFLTKNNDIEVWLPEFFSSSFKETIKKEGATVVEVDNFQKICEGAYTTGVIPGWIKEQSLILDADKGLILVTGCAHPRIVKIISTVKELLRKDIYMVFGGFHLAGFLDEEIEGIISRFRALRVKKVGPCHCSGDSSRTLFAKEYGDDFIKIGVGKEIKVQ